MEEEVVVKDEVDVDQDVPCFHHQGKEKARCALMQVEQDDTTARNASPGTKHTPLSNTRQGKNYKPMLVIVSA